SFAPYRCHRALPSFPTRRSSDLAPTLALGDAALRTLQRGFGPAEMPGILDKLPIRRGKEFLQSHVDADRRAGFGQGFLRNVVARDRKSTRLNSSHVKISYAVFCL